MVFAVVFKLSSPQAKTVFVFVFYQYVVPDGTLQRIQLFCVLVVGWIKRSVSTK
jgi:hypothetical protein